MWWQPINPSLSGASTGWGATDEGEQTPEMAYWDVHDWMGNKIGRVPVPSEALGPKLDDLCMIPGFKASWAKYVLMYRPETKTYENIDGTVEFRLFPAAAKPKLAADWCKKCEMQGQFERTTLMCPGCRCVIGGF
jgi:hypothetical protein